MADDPRADLADLIDRAISQLESGLSLEEGPRPAGRAGVSMFASAVADRSRRRRAGRGR